MGGDNAPGATVEGGVFAARDVGCEVLLVGQKSVIEAELAKHDHKGLPIEIVHASESVGMSESPSLAYRKKKDSSIMVGVKLVKEGNADAFISAGNTGAIMAHSTLVLRLIPGIGRAAITILLPTQKGRSVILDAGANVDCKPQHLFEFGIMGSIYASHVLNKERPEVGLLNIGEEEGKGKEIIQLAAEMLKQSSINFIGNLEAKGVYRGTVDVIVCDGFVGNISLKISESVAEMFMNALKDVFSANMFTKFGYFLVKSSLQQFKKRIDYHEYGGAPLLGLNGTVFVSHGSSIGRTIHNAVKHAAEFVEEGIIDEIRAGMGKNIEIEKAMKSRLEKAEEGVVS
jgi:glycerol-3-phosphate acyltransferase PlsX